MSITKHENTPAVPQAGSTGANMIRESAAVMVDAKMLADAVCNTQMIPKHFQGKPEECAAAMLYGASLGLDPMQSVRQIYVVHGQAALYARAMVALVLGAGHQVWTAESTDESVTVAGQRKGSPHAEQATWTYERAKKAGYTNNEKYRTDPQAMLYSKAASEVCRKIAPDVLNGVYSVEEMQMERVESEVVGVARDNTSRLGAVLNQTSAVEESPSTGAVAEGDQQEAAPEPVESELMIAAGQLKKMGAAMREAGIVERDAALAFVAEVIGREVGSRNDLTRDEAAQVIDALEERPTEQRPDVSGVSDVEGQEPGQ